MKALVKKFVEVEVVPVRVMWGGDWVKTVGYYESSGVCAKVYDPHAKEWVWNSFRKSFWTHDDE